MTYGTVKLGGYRVLYNWRKSKKGKVKTREKMCFSLLSGFAGSLFGNPSDIILVWFQSDDALPKK